MDRSAPLRLLVGRSPLCSEADWRAIVLVSIWWSWPASAFGGPLRGIGAIATDFVARATNFAHDWSSNAAAQCIPKVCKVPAVATFGIKLVPIAPRLGGHMSRKRFRSVPGAAATLVRNSRPTRAHRWISSENDARSASPWRPGHARTLDELPSHWVVAIHQPADKLSRSI
jgi:hypothetical protein